MPALVTGTAAMATGQHISQAGPTRARHKLRSITRSPTLVSPANHLFNFARLHHNHTVCLV